MASSNGEINTAKSAMLESLPDLSSCVVQSPSGGGEMTTRLQVLIAAVIVGGAAIAGPAVRSAAAQQFKYIGPKQCTNCHDHDAEKLWYEKKEIPEVHRLFPDQNNAGHINSLKQLEAKKSDEYAKAIGLADKYDGAGSCVSCHGTVWGGEANAGVSCESCHG